MKPDAYMPFYFRAFWEAIEGQQDFIGIGYLRAITYYWGHNNCQGLRNNDEHLRLICRVEKLNWKDAKEFIFDNDKGFTLSADDMWHQKRAYEEWHKAKQRYELASRAGKIGAEAKWKNRRKKI